MESILIRKLSIEDEIPYSLLLIADPSTKAVNEYISRGECYIACKDNTVIGVYVLIKTRPLPLELVNISLDESYQGIGLGKYLLSHAIDIAKKSGAKALEFGTGNSSISQLAFYQKCGFRIVGIDRDFFKKHYDEKIIENGIECVDMIRLSMDL